MVRRVVLRDHSKRRSAARDARQTQDSGLLTPIGFILAVDDINRVSALRFQDEGGLFRGAPEEVRRAAPPLIDLPILTAASRAVEMDITSLRFSIVC